MDIDFASYIRGSEGNIHHQYPTTANRTSHRTSTEQAPNKLAEQLGVPLFAIVKAIGIEQCSLKVIMEKIELKHRPTFVANYLTPVFKAALLPLSTRIAPNILTKVSVDDKGTGYFNS
mgnify:CR=1 FL=1